MACKKDISCSEDAVCSILYMYLDISFGNHNVEHGADQNIFHGASEVERASKPDIDTVIGWSLECSKAEKILKAEKKEKG